MKHWSFRVIEVTYSCGELSAIEPRASSMERRGSEATPFGEEVGVGLMVGKGNGNT